MLLDTPASAALDIELLTSPERSKDQQDDTQHWSLALGLLLLIAGLVTWAILTFQQPAAPYSNRAMFTLPLLILLVDLGARRAAYRVLLYSGNADSSQVKMLWSRQIPALPQITLPLYLACGVLLNTQTAVLAAFLIQCILQITPVLRKVRKISEALYRVAANGVIVLVGGGSYTIFLRMLGLHRYNVPFSVRPIAALIGALLMLIVCPLATPPLRESTRQQRPLRGFLNYFRGSEARFQAVLLAIGPLLPLVDGLDDLQDEFAWMLFLVPLFAIYYLALLSMRFQRQTEELRSSLQALRQARLRQAELQDYAALVMRAQEDERRRLARELHDDTAQALIALSRGLEALADSRGARRTQADDARWVKDLRELADRSLESVRRACRDLRPSVLDDLGLEAALDWLAGGTTQRGLRCSLRVEGAAYSVPGEAELVFFRIAQEALANAWRHAHANHAEVLLAYEPGRLFLRVQDDGCAFDLAEAGQRHVSGGLGLLGMRERAALVGAELEIVSTPGQGTIVEVRLALPMEP